MFNSTLFQRLWMNLPAAPQGKHTEHPRGQRGEPRKGICRLCKTDGREEMGQVSGLETGSSPEAATPSGPGKPRRPSRPRAQPRCIVLPASSRVLHPQPDPELGGPLLFSVSRFQEECSDSWASDGLTHPRGFQALIPLPH